MFLLQCAILLWTVSNDVVTGVLKISPGHLRCNTRTGIVELRIKSFFMVKVETLATKMSFDCRKGWFDGVVIGGIGWKIFDSTACTICEHSSRLRNGSFSP